jgi:hypothetical protein
MQSVRVSGLDDEGDQIVVVPRPTHSEVDEIVADLSR